MEQRRIAEGEDNTEFYNAMLQKSGDLEQVLKDATVPDIYQSSEVRVTAFSHLNRLGEINSTLRSTLQGALRANANNEFMLTTIGNFFFQLQAELTSFQNYFSGFQPTEDKNLLEHITQRITEVVDQDESSQRPVNEQPLLPEYDQQLNDALKAFINKVRGLFSDYQPSCFISYAWGEAKSENLVREKIAPYLKEAGIKIRLDVIDNAKLGSSVADFIQEIINCQYVLVIGSEGYCNKVGAKEKSVIRLEYEKIWAKYKTAPQQIIRVLASSTFNKGFPPDFGTSSRVYESILTQRAFFQKFPTILEKLYETKMENDGNLKAVFKKYTEEYAQKIKSILDSESQSAAEDAAANNGGPSGRPQQSPSPTKRK